MAKGDIERGLTAGLLAGYARNTEFTRSQRATIPIKISHFEQEGLIYHDEWIDGKTGGGQELLEINGERYTRLYGGGVVTDIELEDLGLDEEKIIDFLTEVINEQQEATRLFADCGPIMRDEWQYKYKIIDREPAIDLTTAKEVISFRGQTVFVHNFLLCRVR